MHDSGGVEVAKQTLAHATSIFAQPLSVYLCLCQMPPGPGRAHALRRHQTCFSSAASAAGCYVTTTHPYYSLSPPLLLMLIHAAAFAAHHAFR